MEQCSKAKWEVFLRGGKTIWWDADRDHRGFAPQKVTCKLKPEQVKSNSRRRCRERTLQDIFSQSLKPTRNPAHKWIHVLEISVPAEHWRWVAAKQQGYFWWRKGISVTEVQGRSHGFQPWICTLENSRGSGSSRVRGRTGWRRRIVQEGSMVSQEKISEDVPGDERAELRLEGEKEIGKC